MLYSFSGVVQDFVTLQKWDHNGAYDLKLLIEKTQRKLATCSKRTTSAASEMITPVLSRSAASIGIELVCGISTHTADDAPDADGSKAQDKSAPSSSTTLTLPRPLQTSIAVFTLWNKMPKVPAVVEAWITSQCMALKQGVIFCHAQVPHCKLSAHSD